MGQSHIFSFFYEHILIVDEHILVYSQNLKYISYDCLKTICKKENFLHKNDNYLSKVLITIKIVKKRYVALL